MTHVVGAMQGVPSEIATDEYVHHSWTHLSPLSTYLLLVSSHPLPPPRRRHLKDKKRQIREYNSFFINQFIFSALELATRNINGMGARLI